MTSTDRFEATIAEWLDAESAYHLPDHLGEVVAQTAVTRQRPAWSSLERWLPMDLTTRASTLAPPRLGRLIVIALLVLALAAAAIAVVGSRQSRVPPPFGTARNGAMVVSADGDVYAQDTVTHARTALIAGAEYDFGTVYSRDGTQFMFLRAASRPAGAGEPPLTLAVSSADGSHVRDLVGPVMGLGWFDWSPDGKQITFLTRDDRGKGVINVIDVASGSVATVDVPWSAHHMTWRPPDGREIIFYGSAIDGRSPGVFAVGPDGSGLRPIHHRAAVDPRDFDGVALSPDGRTIVMDRWVLESDGRAMPRLVLMDADSGAEHEFPTPAGTMSRDGVFSPDGTQLAYIQLDRVSPDQNAYQAAVAPVAGGPARLLGPRQLLPADGSDYPSVVLTWAPDGTAVVGRYGGDDVATYRWLPVDGTAGTELGLGTFEFLDVQRLAR